MSWYAAPWKWMRAYFLLTAQSLICGVNHHFQPKVNAAQLCCLEKNLLNFAQAPCDDGGCLSAKHRPIGHSWGIELDENLTQSVDGELQLDWAGIKNLQFDAFESVSGESVQGVKHKRLLSLWVWARRVREAGEASCATPVATHRARWQPPVSRGLSFATRCSRYGRCTARQTHCSSTCAYTEELCRYLNASLKAANSSG